VAVVGNSKGGELALLLGATYPEDVKAVVGYSPSAVVWQGIAFDREVYHGGPRSPWALRGKPVPFAALARPLPSEMARMMGSWLDEKPINSLSFYQRALQDETAVEEASIAVEKIGGPVLLVSGTDDRLWPSARLSQMAIERLKAHDHPFPREHLRYEGAGHMIALPGYEPEASWTGRFELGGSPKADEFANADSWQKVLGFLRDHLGRGGG
jgi:pimeloyl-ACP methyl ester carboxylesterase